MYGTFRNTNTDDGQSDDVVAVIVPGESRDRPLNEALDKCYRSLRNLSPKHQDPKIGTIELHEPVAAEAKVSSRNVFLRKVDHHFVFTSQTAPNANQSRKKMRFLDGGHTAVNRWPVKAMELFQRLQTTQDEHDKIFDGEAGLESGEEDTYTDEFAALGDKVVPFPFELHRTFWREVYHVWSIKAAVFLEVGSGECLFAAILEHTKCLGIFKSVLGVSGERSGATSFDFGGPWGSHGGTHDSF